MRIKKYLFILVSIVVLSSFLTGCTNEKDNGGQEELDVPNNMLDKSEMFSSEDMEDGYDENNSNIIILSDANSKSNGEGVSILDDILTITQGGTYIFRGELSNGQIVVDAEKTDKVRIVLDGIKINNSSSAPIYIKEADKVFVTLADGADNTISVDGEFVNIDDNNIDAAIFSKEDLTINGAGTINIDNQYGNGITSKDDLIITNGSMKIDVMGHGLEGKDSIRIANGDFTIISGKDGLNSSNEDDLTLGFVYILNGSLNINAEDDGIHADSNFTMDGGTIDISKSYEGIEAKSIDINEGKINLVSSDDGINATNKEQSNADGGAFGKKDIDESVYIKINGGVININAAGDGIDSNGNLYVTGGETYISGPESNGDGAIDYDGEAKITGGIFIAAGFSGMAENFGEDSTQGSILITTKNEQSGGISLKDSKGEEILSYVPDKKYNSVAISHPNIKVGDSYTVSTGDESQEVEVTSLVQGEGGAGFNGERPRGPRGEAPSHEGERPKKPKEGENPPDKPVEGENPQDKPIDMKD